jgi:hypothetical protein
MVQTANWFYNRTICKKNKWHPYLKQNITYGMPLGIRLHKVTTNTLFMITNYFYTSLLTGIEVSLIKDLASL